MTIRRWTEEQFDEIGWHDCHVHSWFIEPTEWGSGTLVFDIDFLTEWIRCERWLEFEIAPATVRIHDVCDLRVELDFRGHEMAAFSIDGIERTVEFDDGKTRVYRYGIDVNFPNGHIEFLGRGCELELRADPVRSKDQRLPVDRRVPLR